MKRCDWCTHDPLYMQYHDEEWGIPVTKDTKLFEMLILEGMQAGLSWFTILKRREGFRELFAEFDPVILSRFTDKRLEKILTNPKIIRNRLKVFGVRQNAKAFLKVQQEFGQFSDYLWQFVGNTQKQNKWSTLGDVPVTSKESDALSKNLKKRGFTFVGSTICYAYMQAVGLVNDHLRCCYRHKEIVNGRSPMRL
jgi:DNA-3-methyladenine glycosylase I